MAPGAHHIVLTFELNVCRRQSRTSAQIEQIATNRHSDVRMRLAWAVQVNGIKRDHIALFIDDCQHLGITKIKREYKSLDIFFSD